MKRRKSRFKSEIRFIAWTCKEFQSVFDVALNVERDITDKNKDSKADKMNIYQSTNQITNSCKQYKQFKYWDNDNNLALA